MGIFSLRSYNKEVAQPYNIEVRSLSDDAATGAGISGEMKMTSKDPDKSPAGGEMTLSGVYAAIEMIAGGLSVLPITVKCYDAESDEDGTWLEDALKSGLMTPTRLIKLVITDMLLFGNGYAYIKRDKRGRATELQYLFSRDVQIHWKKETNTLYYTCSYINGNHPILPKDMLHLVKNTRDGYTGIGVITFAYKAIAISNKTEQAVSDYYNAGLNLCGLMHAKQPMSKSQAQQALKSVEGTVDVGKGKFIKFLPFDIDFERLTESATDAALLDTRHFNIAEIARFFSISPALLLDLANSKYNSIEAANIQYLTQTLLPYVLLIEDEFNKKLIPKKSKLKIDLDERSLLRTDAKSTADYFDTLVNAGILTINEARLGLGYSPAKGASKLIIPFTDLSQNTLADLDNPDWSAPITSSVPVDASTVDSSVPKEEPKEEQVVDSSLPVDASTGKKKSTKKQNDKLNK